MLTMARPVKNMQGQVAQSPPWKDGVWYFAPPYTVKDDDGQQILAAQEANYRLAC